MGKNELYKNEEKTELALLVSVDTGELMRRRPLRSCMN